ncbi:MAG: NusG domain II-containing protein [Eubacterium sp.]|nr:NusG domain II-containing protein [Eubacterium sp.]
MEKCFGKRDGVFLGVLFLVLLAGAAWYSFFGRDDGAVVEITVDGELYGSYALDKNQTVDIIVGETKTNTLVIQNGMADMTKASCPDKLCVHQKAISRTGETIVCLPNRVVAEIKGSRPADLDAVT